MYQICLCRVLGYFISAGRGVEDNTLLSRFSFSLFPCLCSQRPDAFNAGGPDHYGEDTQLLCD